LAWTPSARAPMPARPRSALPLLATFRPSGWRPPERRGNETQRASHQRLAPRVSIVGHGLRTSALIVPWWDSGPRLKSRPRGQRVIHVTPLFVGSQLTGPWRTRRPFVRSARCYR
jgi:hypothetical protein